MLARFAGRGFPVVPAALLLAAVAGCAPAPSSLSDPREILDRAVAGLRGARSVHVDATIEGSLILGAIVPGLPGGSGGALSMTGTRVDGDLDLAGERADLHLQVPALFGLTAELLDVEGTTYVASSLTGTGWRRLDGGSLPAVGSWRPMSWVDGLRGWIEDPRVVPTRLDDAACPAGTCYAVRLLVDTPSLGGSAPLATLGLDVRVDRLTVDLRIDRASLRLSQLVVAADLGSAGTLSSTISLTAWDGTVTISPPPSSEVTSGPLLP